MILQLPDTTTHTEAVATVMVCQALQQTETVGAVAPKDLWQWFDLAGIAAPGSSAGYTRKVAFTPWENWCTRPVNFGEARRAMRSSPDFYPDLIGAALGSQIRAKAPQFNLDPFLGRCEGIVLAPFGLETTIPMAAWRLLVRFIRSYGETVYLVGEPGERIDLAGFTEGEIYSSRSPLAQTQLLQSASLVLGVPNGFTWMAAGLRKPTLVLMPEDIDPGQLFPFNAPKEPFRILGYPRDGLDYASLIIGLRALIAGL